MRTSTTNPQSKSVNQKRGPTTGNENPGSKRADFVKAKSTSGSERSRLADMITDAVASRGKKMTGFRDSSVEGLHTNTNVGRGPRKGNRA